MLKDVFGKYKNFGKEEKTLYKVVDCFDEESFYICDDLEELSILRKLLGDKNTVYELKYFRRVEGKVDVISKKDLDGDCVVCVYASDSEKKWYQGQGKYGMGCEDLTWTEKRQITEYFDLRCLFSTNGVKLETNHDFAEDDPRNNMSEILSNSENEDE